MKRLHCIPLIATFLSLALPVPAKAEEKKPVEPFGKIERLDPRFDKIVPVDAQMEKLAEGFEWSEGPVWISDGEYLLFSDIPNNCVMKWKEGAGTSIYLQPSGYTGEGNYSPEPGSNGLLLDSKRLMSERADHLRDGGCLDDPQVGHRQRRL